MTKILQIGKEILRETAKEADISNLKEIQKVLKEMQKALEKEEDGVALAAPQIGKALRIFIVSKRVFSEKNAKDQIYINPKIINFSKDKEWLEEGCLSVRWKYGKVERADKVTIEAYDEKGKKFQRGAGGLLAQIFQHEIDHLNGILFIDKAKDVHEINPEDLIKKKIKFAFFGTSEFSIYILEKLKKEGYIPSLIITGPDKPKGRKLVMTPSLTKVWAEKNNIKVLQPIKLDKKFIQELKKKEWALFIVASYGKIIPGEVLDIPKYKSINIHPSLLPELRGPSPIQNMILEDKKNTGVSIMLMDEKMDHGPILVQESVKIDEWPKASVLEERLAKISGELLVKVIPNWISGKIKPQEQNHNKATIVKMIEKEDAEIDLKDDGYLNYRKIMAYERWPRAYFFKDGKRVIINDAKFENGKLEILRVTPEGKKEIDYSLFQNTN